MRSPGFEHSMLGGNSPELHIPHNGFIAQARGSCASGLPQGNRRLAAIMFTDVVGFTALGQRNEALSLVLVEEQRNLIRPILKRHNGREVKTIGDAFLVEFLSALDAVRCAYDIQRATKEFNIVVPEDRRIRLRVGVHLGDVVESEGDISGDAVNIASRIEPLAEEGGVSITQQVYEAVRGKTELGMQSLGPKSLKNVSEPVTIYKLVMPWERTEVAPPQELDKRRIAVLPFTNISPNPADEYFADGMTEELITTMSRISGLKVIARTSIMGYKGGQKKIDEVARELRVGTVLEGSVRKAGERLRITIQLIDSQTSNHLWAESYDRELKDIFAIQSDISKTVAEALKVQLLSQEKSVIERKQVVNPEAYTLYLKGRFYWNERTEENVNKAIKYFEQVIRIDPKFAPAYSGLSDCYNILADYSWMAPDRAGPLAKGFSVKALEIDSNLAEAHASLALTLTNHFWDFATAERELVRAIELRPNYAPAHHWYAILLFYLRRLDEAQSQEMQALDLDPFSRVINMAMANTMAIHGKIREAMERYNKVIEQHPDFAALRYWKSQVHVWLSEYEAAIREARKACDLDKSSLMELNLAWVCARAGREDEANRILEAVARRAEHEYVAPVQIGLVELALGHLERGFVLLAKGLEERDSNLLYFGNLPWLKEYWSDPRWMEIDRRLGLANLAGTRKES